jgi:hypothetical protein
MYIIAVVLAFFVILADAHWRDHWAANWLQDLDGKICDHMGKLLGIPPDIRDGCMQWRASSSSSCSTERDCQAALETCNGLLVQERVVRKRKQRQLLAAENRWKKSQQRQALMDAGTDLVTRKFSTMVLQIRQQQEGVHRVAQEEADALRLEVSTEVQHVPNGTSTSSPSPSADLVLGSSLAMLIILIVRKLVCKAPCRNQEDMSKQLQDKTAELLDMLSQLSQIEEDSKTVNTNELQCDTASLDTDFSFRIYDEGTGEERVRFIKIKCPGVHSNDILVDVICHGCIVTIERKSSQGVNAIEWVKKFEFKASDGHFDLKDDNVTLEGGFLTLPFQAFQSRAFRFPKCFDMSLADEEDKWLYSEDSSTKPLNEASLERASRALRIARAASALQRVAVATSSQSSVSSRDGGDVDCASGAPSSDELSEGFEKVPCGYIER